MFVQSSGFPPDSTKIRLVRRRRCFRDGQRKCSFWTLHLYIDLVTRIFEGVQKQKSISLTIKSFDATVSQAVAAIFQAAGQVTGELPARPPAAAPPVLRSYIHPLDRPEDEDDEDEFWLRLQTALRSPCLCVSTTCQTNAESRRTRRILQFVDDQQIVILTSLFDNRCPGLSSDLCK